MSQTTMRSLGNKCNTIFRIRCFINTLVDEVRINKPEINIT